MLFHLAVEDIEPHHWVAYVLDLPGCFSSADNPEEAISQAPQRIVDHLTWLSQHNVVPSLPYISVEVAVVERFRSFESREEPGYIVNAFFEDDRRPLGYWDIEAALRLMKWARQELLDLAQGLTDKQLNQSRRGERFTSASGILKHIAVAENWYFDRMGLGLAQQQLPDDVFDLLTAVRENAEAQLINLVGDGRITQESGEYWSGRKVVRRLLWHERDHTEHLMILLKSCEGIANDT